MTVVHQHGHYFRIERSAHHHVQNRVTVYVALRKIQAAGARGQSDRRIRSGAELKPNKIVRALLAIVCNGYRGHIWTRVAVQIRDDQVDAKCRPVRRSAAGFGCSRLPCSGREAQKSQQRQAHAPSAEFRSRFSEDLVHPSLFRAQNRQFPSIRFIENTIRALFAKPTPVQFGQEAGEGIARLNNVAHFPIPDEPNQSP